MRPVAIGTPAQLDVLAKDIDKALGYPKQGASSDGRKLGPNDGWTLRHAAPEQAPDGQWEYPLGKLPAKAQGIVAKHALPVRERMKRPVPTIIEEQIQ